MTAPKILTLDIETSPNEVHAWGLWNVNVGLNQIMAPTRALCWAAKWHGKRPIIFKSEFHDGREAMVQSIYDLWNESDVLVHFNGTSFDIPHLKREFLAMELPPPKPVLHVDLYRVAKSQFKFPSNKLDYITRYLGLDSKMENEGHGLWTACLQGDEKAWARMRAYNRQDVKVTEQLYDRLRPWIKAHPHLGLFSEETSCCANCGSKNLERRGYNYTTITARQQFRCRDCGRWSTSPKAAFRVVERGAP